MRSTTSLTFVVLLVCSLVACFCAQPFVSATSANKKANVAVELKARWQQTPLAAEASEFFAKQGNDAFWNFLAQYSAKQPASQATPQQQYDDALSIAKTLLEGKRNSQTQMELLKYGLAIRQFSPVVETQQQLARQRFSKHASTLDSDLIAVLQLANGNEIVANSQQSLEQLLSSGDARQKALKEQANTQDNSQEQIFAFDHVFPCNGQAASANSDISRVILYADLVRTQDYRGAHDLLASSSCSAGFQYIFRHFDSKSLKINRQDSSQNENSNKLLSVQGYGVELITKNLEYKQMDENILKYKQEHANEEKQEEASTEKKEGEQQVPEVDPKLLGVQTTQYILQHMQQQNASAIEALQHVLQQFPALVGDISKLSIDEAVRTALTQNQHFSWGVNNALLINGVDVDLEKVSIFGLFDILSSEISWQDVLQTKLHLPSGFAKDALQSLQSASKRLQGLRLGLFRDKQEREDAVFFINDIENDSDYANFSPNIKELTEPAFFGQLRFPRKNAFQTILLVDPSKRDSLEMALSALSMYSRGYPIQMGFLFFDAEKLREYSTKSASQGVKTVDISVNAAASASSAQDASVEAFQCDKGSASVKLLAMFEHFKKSPLKKHVLHVLHTMLQQTPSGQTVSSETMSRVFNQFTRENLDNLVKDSLPKCSKQHMFALSAGLKDAPTAMLFNGRLITINEVHPHAMIGNGLNNDYHNMADLARRDVITDKDEDVQTKMLKELNAVPKFNAKIVDTKHTYITVTNVSAVSNLPFIDNGKSDGKDKHFSYLLLLDLLDQKDIAVLRSALGLLSQEEKSSHRRFTVIHTGEAHHVAQLIIDAISSNDLSSLNSLLEALERSVSLKSVTRDDLLANVPASASIKKQTQSLISTEKLLSTVKSCILSENQGSSRAVVLNGRILEGDDLREWTAADFELLENLDAKRLEKTIESFDKFSEFPGVDPEKITSRFRSDVFFCTASVLGQLESGVLGDRTTSSVVHMPASITKILLNQGEENLALPNVVAIVNPFDDKAHKLVAMVNVLANAFKLPTTLLLNLPTQVENEPRLKKQWYQFVLDSELKFNEYDGSVVPAKAFFRGLPATGNNILTMNLHVPETWLIESTMAEEDLDNINLANMLERGAGETLYARYQLENIIVVGSCNDVGKQGSTRGLQLFMGDRANLHTQDTLVMANYGYFQLKGNPNVWTMQLAPGRHSSVYRIVETSTSPAAFDQKIVEPYQPPSEGGLVTIPMTSFDGPFVHLHVQKRPGMENAELFDPNAEKENNSVWSSLSNMFGSEKTKEDESEYLNVFSLASGHMYERLLKIMILSVVKNTKKRTVKFYLVKNFLSPRFKEFLPKMADKYGFKYQLVTYKWPSWLNKQTEKQRLIWAYKMLFLDVLFPLHVKKFIYVDADQVTRSDLTELYDMSMNGAPLGFAPFCTDKPEMDGYKFWISGYWKQHLQGKPYHISALYRVDVDRLRSMYGGDQIRFYYDNLSKDPNSLSNLDQDLVNYAQHWVPIHTLPQEWLWCESWCSDISKPKAKTIDLCNNPMTKEHKIESARRIIPEWTQLDEEAKQLE